MKKNHTWLTQFGSLRRLVKAGLWLDIGSQNTRVVYGNKLVWHQPTCVTLHVPTQTVLEVGQRALLSMGKTPEKIQVVFPVRQGKISDLAISQQYIRAVVKQVMALLELPFVFQLSGQAAVASSLSPVAMQTWTRVLHESGFHAVQLIRKSQAIQEFLRAQKQPLNWMLDMGAQTTELGIFLGDEVLQSHSLNLGGHDITTELQDLLRTEYQATLSYLSAEALKVAQHSLHLSTEKSGLKSAKTTLRATDLVTQEPKVIYLDKQDLELHFGLKMKELVDEIKAILAQLSTEMRTQLLEGGLYLTGGASGLSGAKEFLESELKTTVTVARQPELDLVWGVVAADRRPHHA